MKAYDLIYYIDMHVTEQDFPGYFESIETLVKYLTLALYHSSSTDTIWTSGTNVSANRPDIRSRSIAVHIEDFMRTDRSLGNSKEIFIAMLEKPAGRARGNHQPRLVQRRQHKHMVFRARSPPSTLFIITIIFYLIITCEQR